jgi:two-component system, chemotaxis family, sensor kinase Cph1
MLDRFGTVAQECLPSVQKMSRRRIAAWQTVNGANTCLAKYKRYALTMPPEVREARSDGLDPVEFLMHVSHDLRTALRAIRVHADLLLKGHPAALAPDLEERLGYIVDGATKIDLLADGIASYSIAQQIRRESFQPAPMDVLFRAVLAKLDKELRANGASVANDKLPRVSGDPDRLMEVLENLIRNALRHRNAGPPPQIQLTVERLTEEWLFTVRDNGPGVPTAYLEKIFRPFVRLEINRVPGPGLGLATCRAILERHGGRIWAESSDGAGGVFRFTLPAD